MEVRRVTVLGLAHRLVRLYRDEQRRTMSFEQLEDGRRRHRAWPENRRGSDRERKIHRVAEPVRKEQLGDAEAAVRGFDAEHAARVGLRADGHVVLQMHTGLGATGAAR